MKIAFIVPTIPKPKGRPRFTVRNGFARAYTPAATVNAEHDIAVLAAQHAPEAPHDGPVRIELDFVLPVPPSWPQRKRKAALTGALLPTGKPDLDNLEKLVLDALTRSGQWWTDDSRIVESRPRKLYGATPCTRIVVELVTGVDQRDGAGELFQEGVA